MKYGLSYYTSAGDSRVPQSGLQVRLVRPGGDWATGLPLVEKETTGFYEIELESETDWGYYEIWDNRDSPSGSFSGRTEIIGKLDARGLQNRCIYTNHIEDGHVTGPKIAAGAIENSHLQNGSISLLKVKYQISNQLEGIGNISLKTPAEVTDDYATHDIPGAYSSIPIILLTPMCDQPLWIENVGLSGEQLTIKVGIGGTGTALALKYDIVILG
jgi:hypothetical protein